MLLVIRLNRVVTYSKELPPLHLHDPSMRWSCKVKWQIKYIIISTIMRLMVSKPGRVLIYVEVLARKRLSRYQLLVSKAYGMLWSYIRNFTVKRTLTKTFAEVSNEKRPIQVTRFLGNEWWNICKKAFFSHYWRTNKKEQKKTTTTQAVAKLFALYANAKITCFDNDLSNLLSLPTSSLAIFFLAMSYKERIGLQAVISFYGHNSL